MHSHSNSHYASVMPKNSIGIRSQNRGIGPVLINCKNRFYKDSKQIKGNWYIQKQGNKTLTGPHNKPTVTLVI